MNTITTCATVLCATMLCATGAGAQKWNRCDPRYYPISPTDCTTYGDQAAKVMAKMRVAIGEENAAIVSGAETIEIKGKSFTYNETAGNKGCCLVVKVWTSESVLTGLVKKLDDVTCPKPVFGQVPRFMIETYLDSFEGFTPVANK